MKKILFSLIIIIALFGNINIAEAQYAHPGTAIKTTNGNVQSDINALQANTGTLENRIVDNLDTIELELADITAEISLIDGNLATIETRIDSNETAFLDQCDKYGATGSSGFLTRGTFSVEVDGSISYDTSTVVLKTSDSMTAPLAYFTIPADSIPVSLMTPHQVHYAYLNYNNGNPQVLVTTDSSTIRYTDQFIMWRFFRNDAVTYLGTPGPIVSNFAANENERLKARGVAERISGAVIEEKPATRYLTISESVFYGGTSYQTKEASDSQTDGFEHYYSYNASTLTWTDNVATYPNAIDNTKYNNTTTGALVDLTNNQYGVHWIYLGGTSKMSVVFGHNTYKLNEAMALQPPTTLPDYLSKFAVLVGRVIIKKGDSSFTSVDSSFSKTFVTSTVEHNDTINRDTASAHPSSAIDYTDTYSMGVTTIQSAIDTIENWLGRWSRDSNVYGFVYPVTATLSYDDTTQTFSITGNHDVYINGKRITKTTASKTHPATTGVHYFYYNSDGVLTTSTDLWGNDFFHICHVAYVYYNASKATMPRGLLFDEDHSHIMSTATHYYEHVTRGACSPDLFPIGSYSTAPAIPTNDGNTFATAGGTLYDEDHIETINEVPDNGYYPIFWREGTTDWTWASGTYPVLVGTNYPKYNQLSGGVYTTTEVTANQYINMYVAVTNANNDTYSVILITGQNVYATLALAQAANPLNTMNWGGLPFNEVIITNKIIFRTNNGYTSIAKCRIESVENLAGVSIRLGSAVSATSHSSLSNRTDAGSHPGSAISYVDNQALGTTDLQSTLDTVAVWLANHELRLDSIESLLAGGATGEVIIRTNTGYRWGTITGVTDHLLLTNIGTKTHAQLEIDITGINAYLSSLNDSQVAISGFFTKLSGTTVSGVLTSIDQMNIITEYLNQKISIADTFTSIYSTGMITGECQIFLDGVLQRPGFDYVFDLDNETFFNMVSFIKDIDDDSQVSMSALRATYYLYSPIDSAAHIKIDGFIGLADVWSGLVLPTTVENLLVTELGYMSLGNPTISLLTLNEGLATIGQQAFYGSSIATLDIPSTVTSIHEQAFEGASLLETITVNASNTVYADSGNCLFNSDLTTLYAVPVATSWGFAIPVTVTTIGNYALKDSLVDTIDIFEGITSIGNYAMASCSALTFVEIPTTVLTIGEYAFYLTPLSDMTLNEGLVEIKAGAFSACSLLTVEIPSTVTTIGDYAFSGNYSLSSATFAGDAPTTFGTDAFVDCDANFKIYYPTGASGWTTPTWNGYTTEAY